MHSGDRIQDLLLRHASLCPVIRLLEQRSATVLISSHQNADAIAHAGKGQTQWIDERCSATLKWYLLDE